MAARWLRAPAARALALPALAFERLQRAWTQLWDASAEFIESVERAQDADEGDGHDRLAGLESLNRATSYACTLGELRLGEVAVQAAPREPLSKRPEDGVIAEVLKRLHYASDVAL